MSARGRAVFMLCSVCCLTVVFIGPVKHCEPFIGKERASCFAFIWFGNCVLSVAVCLVFSLGFIGRFCSLVVTLAGHFLYCLSCLKPHQITNTCLYNFEPLKPHFYIAKLGFTGVYIIFLIFAQKHILCVLVRTASPGWF